MTPMALAASVVAGAWDQNVTLPIMSPWPPPWTLKRPSG